MATLNGKILKNALKSFISNEELRKLAQETGCVKRVKKVDVAKLFGTLILSFGLGKKRELEEIRRVYNGVAEPDKTVVKSSFHDRFDESFALFLKKVLKIVCDRFSNPPKALLNLLEAFEDLILIDSTIMKLHDNLERDFPGCGRRSGDKIAKAELKVQLVMGALSEAPMYVNFASGRSHETKTLEIGDWVANKVLLMDLGYYSHELFNTIHEYGGYFVSRIIWSVNPFLLNDNCPDGKHPLFYIGNRFKEILESRARDVWDLEVLICKDRATSGRFLNTMRIVSVWDTEEERYHNYITNISSDILSAEKISRIYALRWEIEMIFKELKSIYRLDQLPSKKKPVIEALVCIALLGFIVGRRILFGLRDGYDISASRSPERLFAKVFANIASEILRVLFLEGSNKKIWIRHENSIVREMIAPKRSRKHNLSVVEN
jgi:hypothetical protein